MVYIVYFKTSSEKSHQSLVSSCGVKEGCEPFEEQEQLSPSSTCARSGDNLNLTGMYTTSGPGLSSRLVPNFEVLLRPADTPQNKVRDDRLDGARLEFRPERRLLLVSVLRPPVGDGKPRETPAPVPQHRVSRFSLVRSVDSRFYSLAKRKRDTIYRRPSRKSNSMLVGAIECELVDSAIRPFVRVGSDEEMAAALRRPIRRGALCRESSDELLALRFRRYNGNRLAERERTRRAHILLGLDANMVTVGPVLAVGKAEIGGLDFPAADIRSIEYPGLGRCEQCGGHVEIYAAEQREAISEQTSRSSCGGRNDLMRPRSRCADDLTGPDGKLTMLSWRPEESDSLLVKFSFASAVAIPMQNRTLPGCWVVEEVTARVQAIDRSAIGTSGANRNADVLAVDQAPRQLPNGANDV